MDVIFKYHFFDGRNRFKPGPMTLPDDYPRALLPKSVKIVGEKENEPELDLVKAKAPVPPAVPKPKPTSTKKG